MSLNGDPRASAAKTAVTLQKGIDVCDLIKEDRHVTYGETGTASRMPKTKNFEELLLVIGICIPISGGCPLVCRKSSVNFEKLTKNDESSSIKTMHVRTYVTRQLNCLNQQNVELLNQAPYNPNISLQ